APGVLHVDADAQRSADACRDFGDPLFGKVARPAQQGPRRPAQFSRLRDDIVRVTAVEAGDGNDAGIERIEISRDDRLQRADDLRAGGDGIAAAWRAARMSPGAPA